MSDNFLIPTPDQLKEDNAKLRKRIDELLEEKLIEVDREQKLWELYKQQIAMGLGGQYSDYDCLLSAAEALAVWEEKAPGILASARDAKAELKEGE